MSSDQWDSQETVRIRLFLVDGNERWSQRMTRWEAELFMASADWLCAPCWPNDLNDLTPVAQAAIVRWTYL
jgi:hypothetical protein